MTKSRKSVYNRSWYDRECKIDMRKRRKEYNRKIRHAKLSDDTGDVFNLRRAISWNTVS